MLQRVKFQTSVRMLGTEHETHKTQFIGCCEYSSETMAH